MEEVTETAKCKALHIAYKPNKHYILFNPNTVQYVRLATPFKNIYLPSLVDDLQEATIFSNETTLPASLWKEFDKNYLPLEVTVQPRVVTIVE